MPSGGKRANSGRKKREETKVVSFKVPTRIADEFKDQAKLLINSLKARKSE